MNRWHHIAFFALSICITAALHASEERTDTDLLASDIDEAVKKKLSALSITTPHTPNQAQHQAGEKGVRELMRAGDDLFKAFARPSGPDNKTIKKILARFHHRRNHVLGRCLGLAMDNQCKDALIQQILALIGNKKEQFKLLCKTMMAALNWANLKRAQKIIALIDDAQKPAMMQSYDEIGRSLLTCALDAQKNKGVTDQTKTPQKTADTVRFVMTHGFDLSKITQDDLIAINKLGDKQLFEQIAQAKAQANAPEIIRAKAQAIATVPNTEEKKEKKQSKPLGASQEAVKKVQPTRASELKKALADIGAREVYKDKMKKLCSTLIPLFTHNRNAEISALLKDHAQEYQRSPAEPLAVCLVTAITTKESVYAEKILAFISDNTHGIDRALVLSKALSTLVGCLDIEDTRTLLSYAGNDRLRILNTYDHAREKSLFGAAMDTHLTVKPLAQIPAMLSFLLDEGVDPACMTPQEYQELLQLSHEHQMLLHTSLDKSLLIRFPLTAAIQKQQDSARPDDLKQGINIVCNMTEIPMDESSHTDNVVLGALAPSVESTRLTQLCKRFKKAVFEGNIKAMQLCKTLAGDNWDTILNAQDVHGRNALHHAVLPNTLPQKQRIAVLDFLLTQDITWQYGDKTGITPLMLAITLHLDEEMTTLLAHDTAQQQPLIDDNQQTVLHYAILANNSTALEALLTHQDRLLASSMINAPDQSGVTPLMLAANLGNPDHVTALLTAHADPFLVDHAGNSALNHAMRRAHKPERKPIIQEILKQVAVDPTFINKPNNAGVTPLAGIVETTDDCELIRLFLEYGADPNIPNNNNQTPLMCAADGKKHDVMHLLLEYGASVTARGSDGHAALAIACGVEDNGEIITCLLDHMEHPCISEDELTVAIGHQNIDVIGYMLHYPLNEDVPRFSKERPLAVAIKQGLPRDFIEKIVGLYKSHATTMLNQDTHTHHPVLLLAIAHHVHAFYSPEEYRELKEFFGQQGATLGDLNAIDERDGQTLLTRMCAHHDLDAMKALLAEGANPDQPNQAGDTPSIIASRKVDYDAIQLLFKKGAHIDTRNQITGEYPRIVVGFDVLPTTLKDEYMDWLKKTPIHELRNNSQKMKEIWQKFRATNPESEALFRLIDQNSSPLAQDEHGMTNLAYLVTLGNLPLVKSICTAANIKTIANTRNNAGQTAYMLAKKHGHEDIATLLEGLGVDTTLPPVRRHKLSKAKRDKLNQSKKEREEAEAAKKAADDEAAWKIRKAQREEAERIQQQHEKTQKKWEKRIHQQKEAMYAAEKTTATRKHKARMLDDLVQHAQQREEHARKKNEEARQKREKLRRFAEDYFIAEDILAQERAEAEQRVAQEIAEAEQQKQRWSQEYRQRIEDAAQQHDRSQAKMATIITRMLAERTAIDSTLHKKLGVDPLAICAILANKDTWINAAILAEDNATQKPINSIEDCIEAAENGEYERLDLAWRQSPMILRTRVPSHGNMLLRDCIMQIADIGLRFFQTTPNYQQQMAYQNIQALCFLDLEKEQLTDYSQGDMTNGIFRAVKDDNRPMVHMFLKHYPALISVQDPITGNNLRHEAVMYGRKHISNILDKQNTGLQDMPNKVGKTPLDLAMALSPLSIHAPEEVDTKTYGDHPPLIKRLT